MGNTLGKIKHLKDVLDALSMGKDEDQSKCCRRCGEEGHVVKDCDKDPSCMLCKGKKCADNKHAAASGKCPFFRRPLKAANR